MLNGPSEPQRHPVGLGIFRPIRFVARGRVMLVVQPSGGSASQPILGLGRVACGAAGRRHADGALQRDRREFPALAMAVLSSLARDGGVSGEGLHYRAGTDYPRVFRYRPDNQEGESRRTALYFVAHWWDRTPRDDGRPSLSTSGKETKRVRHYCLAPVRREGFLRYYPA